MASHAIIELRKRRERLYELLMLVHAGPLGHAFIEKLKQESQELFGNLGLQPISTALSADGYKRCYDFCQGNRVSGCSGSKPAQCIPAKFLKLSKSASKGAYKRRLNELNFIREDLIPCLRTNVFDIADTSYKELMKLSLQVVEADAAFLESRYFPHEVLVDQLEVAKKIGFVRSQAVEMRQNP